MTHSNTRKSFRHECTVLGCPGQHWARGLCKKHYMRWRRSGDVVLRVGQEPDAAEPCAWCGDAVPVNSGRASLYCRAACRASHKRLKRRENAIGATP